jgi:hypothetical protein
VNNHKLSALDLSVILDTLSRTLSIAGFEQALGGYTKDVRQAVLEKVYAIMQNMEMENS